MKNSAPEVEIRNRHLPNAFQKRYDFNDLLGKVKSQEVKPNENINARCACLGVCVFHSIIQLHYTLQSQNIHATRYNMITSFSIP